MRIKKVFSGPREVIEAFVRQSKSDAMSRLRYCGRRDAYRYTGNGSGEYRLHGNVIASYLTLEDQDVEWVFTNAGWWTHLTANRLNRIVRMLESKSENFCLGGRGITAGGGGWYFCPAMWTQLSYPLVARGNAITSPVNLYRVVETALRMRNPFRFMATYMVITYVFSTVLTNVYKEPTPGMMVELHKKYVDTRFRVSSGGRSLCSVDELVPDWHVNRYHQLKQEGRLPAWLNATLMT